MKFIDRWIRGVLVTAVLGLLPSACIVGIVDLDDDDSHSGDIEVSAEFFLTVPVDGRDLLTIHGANGTIAVKGAIDANEVIIEGVRSVRSDGRRDAERHLDLLDVAVHSGPREVSVETVQPKHSSGRTYIVDYEITIPADWDVVLQNGNGTVCVGDLDGDVEVGNGNGNVTLDDVYGSSWIDLGNGIVDALVFLPDGGEMVYAVGNGMIKVALQPDPSAEFSATVGNGPIVLSGLTLHQTSSGPGFLKGILGDGHGLIDLSVGNGSVEVRSW
jgi:hypothetical protein